MKKVLMVCTGNTCRSPMAKGILELLLKEAGQEESVKVDSAGTSVFFPDGANYNAVEAVRSMGIDLSDHVAKEVDEKLIANADLILTMTTRQKYMLQNAFPGYAYKITTLKEQAQATGSLDVSDPYGSSLAVYIRTAEELREILHILIHQKKL